MTEDNPKHSFSEMVSQQLTPDIRELWEPMADYFNREGPEAVKTYLDAVRGQLEESVRSQLEQYKGS